jgi:hypothetical protein
VRSASRSNSDLGVEALSEEVRWDPSDVAESLQRLGQLAESNAIAVQQWYLTEKVSKARWSKALRLAAASLALGGTLIPLIALAGVSEVSASWGYVLLAAGAGCIAIDRVFGFSSSWLRYMTAAMRLSRIIREFQYSSLTRTAPVRAGSESVLTEEGIGRVLTFNRAVAEVVEDETAEWVAEFTSALTALETAVDRR